MSEKLVCNLSGESKSFSADNYAKKVSQYGSEDNLKKFYIQNKFAKMLQKGNSLEAIASTCGLTLDPAKEDYYKELIDFYKPDKKQVNSVETKVSFLKTDDDVKDFIKRLGAKVN